MADSGSFTPVQISGIKDLFNFVDVTLQNASLPNEIATKRSSLINALKDLEIFQEEIIANADHFCNVNLEDAIYDDAQFYLGKDEDNYVYNDNEAELEEEYMYNDVHLQDELYEEFEEFEGKINSQEKIFENTCNKEGTKLTKNNFLKWGRVQKHSFGFSPSKLWCGVLDDKIYFYKNVDSDQPSLVLSLDDIIIQEASAKTEDKLSKNFIINSSAGKFLFLCDDQEDVDDWREKLKYYQKHRLETERVEIGQSSKCDDGKQKTIRKRKLSLKPLLVFLTENLNKIKEDKSDSPKVSPTEAVSNSLKASPTEPATDYVQEIYDDVSTEHYSQECVEATAKASHTYSMLHLMRRGLYFTNKFPSLKHLRKSPEKDQSKRNSPEKSQSKRNSPEKGQSKRISPEKDLSKRNSSLSSNSVQTEPDQSSTTRHSWEGDAENNGFKAGDRSIKSNHQLGSRSSLIDVPDRKRKPVIPPKPIFRDGQWQGVASGTASSSTPEDSTQDELYETIEDQQESPQFDEYMAKFACVCHTSEGLSFNKGEIIQVLSKNDDGWWECTSRGKTGLVRKEYLVNIS